MRVIADGLADISIASRPVGWIKWAERADGVRTQAQGSRRDFDKKE
jgi:hypothetical protein